MRIQVLTAWLLMTITIFGYAQNIREERVQFAPGTSGATITDSIRGYEIVDYLLRAEVGQQMSVDLQISNSSGYFNVMIGDNPEAIHIGSINGNSWTGTLPETGDYRIRVYLMRNAARRDEVADYSLSVEIGKRHADFADGLSGGPDYWEVTGVPANDTLNIRAAPGSGHDVIGELANGDRVTNRGCEMVGNSRWCQVEAGLGMQIIGWVNGRYLREATR